MKTSGNTGRIIAYPVAIGMTALTLFVGTFVAWSSMAHLSSAIVVGGTIETDAPKYLVQHLQGGTVSAILVNNSDKVEQGQLLVKFDMTSERAKLQSARHSLVALHAEKQKYQALLANRQQLIFSTDLTALAKTVQYEDILQLEKQRFELDRHQYTDIQTQLSATIASLKAIIPDMQSQMAARLIEHNIMKERVAAMRMLAEAGHSSTNELRIIRSQAANKAAELADARTKLNLRRQELQNARLQSAALLPKRQSELATGVAGLKIKLVGLLAGVKELEITIENAVLRAPISGKIVDMQISTVGQVVGSGSRIMEIIAWSPVNSLKVKIKPTDIDRVWTGQKANIVLTAFPRRNMPQIMGEVLSISADTIEDRDLRQKFYEARIQLNAPWYHFVMRKKNLVPGLN